MRAMSPTPVDGDPDVSDELFIYNDRRWYYFTGSCFGCNVLGFGAGAAVDIRCTPPQSGAVPPTLLAPQSSSCGTAIRYNNEVQQFYVAMSAPSTTPAGPRTLFINASVAGAPQWSVLFAIPFQIRAAASARFPIRMSFFIPPAWIWGPPWEACIGPVGETMQLAFAGDNRSFSATSPEYRGLSMATADVLLGTLS